MNAKNWNRLLLAFWMLYLPIVQLGSTGSYEQAWEAFGILAVTAILGWMERDHTKVGADGTALERPNVEVTGAARLYRAASVWTAGLAPAERNIYLPPGFSAEVCLRDVRAAWRLGTVPEWMRLYYIALEP